MRLSKLQTLLEAAKDYMKISTLQQNDPKHTARVTMKQFISKIQIYINASLLQA